MDNQQLFMKDLNKFIGFKKGVIEIIDFDSTEYNKTNNKNIFANCVCLKCGAKFKINLDKLLKPAQYYEHNCPNCKQEYRKSQIIQRLTNVSNGVLTFVDFDHFDKSRAYVKCKCSRCGQTTIVRDDRLKSKNIPLSCEHCYNSLNSQNVKMRYQKQYNLTGEEYEQEKRIKNKIQSLRKGAEIRKIQFNLSDSEAKNLLLENCYYCNSSEFIGIDRIDSSKDYSINNCVPCCKYCNLMKNNLQYDLFLNQIHKIFNHRISNSTTIENTEDSGSE
jgi:predicted RNA-binding Zn-ribbon protein involved in translation (DUF1610 family)